jgi:alanine racemase
MTLATKIIAIQAINTMANVGYGSTFEAKSPMTIGIVACGYADGYLRHCSTGTPVLVAGVRTRIVGRVSMDMITVDLEPLLQAGIEVGIGTEVTLWGKASNGALLSIDEVAHAGGTVGYELMCALAQRVPTVVDHTSFDPAE